jgi:hypothetical protein
MLRRDIAPRRACAIRGINATVGSEVADAQLRYSALD